MVTKTDHKTFARRSKSSHKMFTEMVLPRSAEETRFYWFLWCNGYKATNCRGLYPGVEALQNPNFRHCSCKTTVKGVSCSSAQAVDLVETSYRIVEDKGCASFLASVGFLCQSPTPMTALSRQGPTLFCWSWPRPFL